VVQSGQNWCDEVPDCKSDAVIVSPLMLSLDQLVRIMRSLTQRTSAFARIAAAKIVLALAQGERVAMPRMRIR
jgi:hypothetical protein